MPLYYSNFKSFSNKISRIFLFEQLYVRPLLAILKGQYRPWAQRGRPGQGWYGWISTFWCHSKLPYDGHSIPVLPKQIIATLLSDPGNPIIIHFMTANLFKATQKSGKISDINFTHLVFIRMDILKDILKTKWVTLMTLQCSLDIATGLCQEGWGR